MINAVSCTFMLPFKTGHQLSVNSGKVRDVISVTCEVKIKKGVITVGKADIFMCVHVSICHEHVILVLHFIIF